MIHREQPAGPRPFGAYLLLDELGRGGMGSVSLACREAMPGIWRQCVVKTLRSDHVADRARPPAEGKEPSYSSSGADEYVRRFLDEARVVVRLQHSHICPVFDVGVVNGEHYLAMEYVAGRDLRLVGDAVQRSGAAMEPGVALYIVSAVLEALDYAHRLTDPATGTSLQLVHRDVSPHNVMIGFEGDVRLIDFGLAQSTLKLEKTSPNIVLGKISYMAPEQLYGQPLDPRADQFAVAILATELLTGDRFYEGRPSSEVQILAAKGTFRPHRFQSLPAELRQILDRALAFHRADRWPSCGAMREALEAFRFRAGWRGDGPALRALMHRVCSGDIAAEADRQRRYAARLQAAMETGLTESIQRMVLPPVGAQVTLTASSSFASSAIPQTMSFLGSSEHADERAGERASAPRTLATLPMEAGAGRHPSGPTVAMGASPPPPWAMQHAPPTMRTVPMTSSPVLPTTPSPPRAPEGATMKTVPMAPTPIPQFSAHRAGHKERALWVAGGAVLASALLMTGMWLGRPDAPPPAFSNAVMTPTATPPSGPSTAPTVIPTTAAQTPTAASTTALVPVPARTAKTKTAPAAAAVDPHVRAARERLERLRQACPQSPCLAHFDWVSGASASSSPSLKTAPRALELCLARCEAEQN
jgi:serine/threonine-protein kinase